MSGAQAPKYSDEEKAHAVRLVLVEGKSYREAERITGVNSSTIANAVTRHRQDNPPEKPPGGLMAEVADYADRLSSVANREIAILEGKKGGQVPLEQLEKALKVVTALDKLAKSHPGEPGDKPPAPESVVAKLAADLPSQLAA